MNKVILMGRLTKDPQIRYTQSGTAVATFNLAVDRRKTGKEEANGQPTADFINCVAWQKTAETIGNYAPKGTKIVVEGRIQTRNYDNQQGQKVYVTEVVVERFEFAESKKNQGTAPAPAQSNQQYGQTIPDGEIPF